MYKTVNTLRGAIVVSLAGTLMLAGGPVLAAVSSQQADRLGSEELTRSGGTPRG